MTSSWKTESCHNANFVVPCGTVRCHYDNRKCHEWRISVFSVVDYLPARISKHDLQMWQVKGNLLVSRCFITLDVSHFRYVFHGSVVRMSYIRLTHWGRYKMVAISETAFSNSFSWMKMYWFRLKFHQSLSPRVQLTIFQHCFRYGVTPTRRQAIIWTNDDYFTDTYMHSTFNGCPWQYNADADK